MNVTKAFAVAMVRQMAPPFPFVVCPGRGVFFPVTCDCCWDVHVTDEFLRHIQHWVFA